MDLHPCLDCPMNGDEGRQDEAIKFAADAIRTCDILIVTAGAGMSVESGIPDFVDIEKALPELKNLGLSVFDISNADLFLEKPRFAWGVLQQANEGLSTSDSTRRVWHSPRVV